MPRPSACSPTNTIATPILETRPPYNSRQHIPRWYKENKIAELFSRVSMEDLVAALASLDIDYDRYDHEPVMTCEKQVRDAGTGA